MADSIEVCDNVQGVSVPTNVETTSLTGFVNEACDQVSIRGSGAMKLTEMFTDSGKVMDVKDYFSRPINISNIPYTATAPLQTIALTNSYLQSTLFNFSRISGAFGWRATVCFRLQAISNPFQGGIIRMAFSPFQVANAEQYYDRTQGITAVSQLPGVELDLAESTSAILKIPFIHPFNYFYVATPETVFPEKLGDLILFPYTGPSLGSGATNATLSLWMWLEDFEIISATAPAFVAQSGMSSKKTTMAKEEAQVPGNLSNVLAAGSKFATWLGSKIPVISSYAGPTAWFMRQASNIAASYGWARPLTVLPCEKMIQTNNVYQNNADGVDPSFNLGLFSDNTIAPLPGFAGSGVDEMALDYLKSVYAVVSPFSLSTSDTAGQYVRAIQCCPAALYYNISNLTAIQTTFPTATTGLSIWPSPVFALANAFKLYRGGLKFRVKIGKTKFHTGRLIVGFVPYNSRLDGTNVYVPSNPSNMQFKSAIWDLREGNTFEMECPFTSPYSYLNWDQNYGSFFIAILDPLAGPSTVSQTVEGRVEVCAMDDFEFAQPRQPLFPLAPASTLYVAQSGMSEPREAPSDTPSLFCIGEKINSVKQLIARAGIVSVISTSTSRVFDTRQQLPVWNSVVTPTTLQGIDVSMYNYFLPFYMMARGGVNVHAVPIGRELTLSAWLDGNNTITGGSLVTESATALHVKVPYYSLRSRGLPASISPQYSNPATVTIGVSKRTGSSDTALVFKRAADDFQLGYFVGAPPLAVPFTTANNLDTVAKLALTTDH